MHSFFNCDLLQPGPKDEAISVVCVPPGASSHQSLSQVDMEHPVIDCLLLDAAPDVQPSCFDES